MRLLVVTECRYRQHPNGIIIAEGAANYNLLHRYLTVFDEVVVIGRLVSSNFDRLPNGDRADGPGIHFCPLPNYKGSVGYLRLQKKIDRAISDAIASTDACIIRTPGVVGFTVSKKWRQIGRPYGVEVVADPYDAFAPGSVKHPLRPVFRRWFTHHLRRQCAQASAAAYVTQYALQQRYPPAPDTFSTYYSDVQLPDTAFVTGPRASQQRNRGLTLIAVGMMDQLYKAHDLLIDAVAKCVRAGLDLRLILVGDGKYRPELETRPAALELNRRICFLGRLPAGPEVQTQLDQADIFVMPSKTEGLPRAMIEAMARGLPCIGSAVGGVPELLSAEDIVPPGDEAALVSKITEVATNPQRMTDMSTRNLKKAWEYHSDVLATRRIQFYTYVRQTTENWLRAKHISP